MENIYIFGANGFIGKSLVKQFSSNYNVFAFDRSFDNDFFNCIPNVSNIKLDVIKQSIPDGIPTPNYIINLISIVTAERNLELFDALISSNLTVLLSLYNRFKNVKELKLFMQFGSSEEYGNIISPLNEYNREEPNSPYSLVKQLTSNTAMMLYGNYEFPTMVVRPGNLFGDLQPSSKFIPYVISKLKKDEELNVTPCEQKRDFIYINDFCLIIEEIFSNYQKVKGKIVNISSGDSISLKEIISHCKDVIGSKSKINYGAIEYRENEVMNLRCDVSLLEAIIGRKVKFDVKTRLTQLIEK